MRRIEFIKTSISALAAIAVLPAFSMGHSSFVRLPQPIGQLRHGMAPESNMSIDELNRMGYKFSAHRYYSNGSNSGDNDLFSYSISNGKKSLSVHWLKDVAMLSSTSNDLDFASSYKNPKLLLFDFKSGNAAYSYRRDQLQSMVKGRDLLLLNRSNYRLRNREEDRPVFIERASEDFGIDSAEELILVLL